MGKLVSYRQFVYDGTAEDIKKYVTALGYETQDVYNYDHKSHKDEKTIAFNICNTTINVGYQSELMTKVNAMAMVYMRNDELVVSTDPEKAERSIKLYNKLYRKFRKRWKDVSGDQEDSDRIPE